MGTVRLVFACLFGLQLVGQQQAVDGAALRQLVPVSTQRCQLTLAGSERDEQGL